MADGLRGLWERIKSRLPEMQSLYRESNKRSWSDNKEISNIISNNPIMRKIIQVESSNKPDAVSRVDAVGLTQVMPKTGWRPGFGIKNTLVDIDEDLYNKLKSKVRAGELTDKQAFEKSITRDDRKDPVKNVKFGTEYFNALKNKFGGDTKLALIAFNWGPGNAKNWLESGADPSKLPKETSDYLEKVLGGESLMVEPMTVASLQDDTMALAYKGGMVYRNYHDYKPKSI